MILVAFYDKPSDYIKFLPLHGGALGGQALVEVGGGGGGGGEPGGHGPVVAPFSVALPRQFFSTLRKQQNFQKNFEKKKKKTYVIKYNKIFQPNFEKQKNNIHYKIE